MHKRSTSKKARIENQDATEQRTISDKEITGKRSPRRRAADQDRKNHRDKVIKLENARKNDSTKMKTETETLMTSIVELKLNANKIGARDDESKLRSAKNEARNVNRTALIPY